MSVVEDILPTNILIIDDHKMVRDGLKMMLASLKKTLLFKAETSAIMIPA